MVSWGIENFLFWMREALSLPSTPRIFRNSALYGKVKSHLSKKWKSGCVGKVNDSALISRRIDLAARLSAAVFDPATKGRGLRERQGRRAHASTRAIYRDCGRSGRIEART